MAHILSRLSRQKGMNVCMQLSSLSPCYSSGSQPGNGPTHNKDDSVHLHYHGQDNPTPPCPEPTSEVILDPVSLTTVTITSGNISASGVGKKEYGQHFGSLLGHLLALSDHIVLCLTNMTMGIKFDSYSGSDISGIKFYISKFLLQWGLVRRP